MAGNQYKPDPRQANFLKNYLDPKSPTYSNAYQSAIKAGYEEEYAKVITAREPDWQSEAIRTDQMVAKAERNLNNMLDLDEEDTHRLKIKADVSKFVAERLGKNKYSSKQEIEHSGTIEMKQNSELDKLAEKIDKENVKNYETNSGTEGLHTEP